MADHAHDDEFAGMTAGHKASDAAKKHVDDILNLDAEDESMVKYKASLGVVAGAQVDTSKPKVEVLTLELCSPTLPPGKQIIFNLSDLASLADTKKNPIIIKEGTEYNVRITFRVNHSIISGLKYLHIVKRAGVQVDKLQAMVGSYGPSPGGTPYIKNFDSDESPSGMLARSGTNSVRSRVTDDDNEIYADWTWYFKIGKEW